MLYNILESYRCLFSLARNWHAYFLMKSKRNNIFHCNSSVEMLKIV